MRPLKSAFLACAATLLLAACTHDYRPDFDVVASNPKQPYDADLGQCRDVASQQAPATAKTVVGATAGGVAGATTGAVLGALTTRGAIWGAVVGARAGAVEGGDTMGAERTAKEHGITDECLRNRGWAVL